MDNQNLVNKKPEKIKIIVIVSILVIAVVILQINKKNQASQLLNKSAEIGRGIEENTDIKSAETDFDSLDKVTTTQQFGVSVIAGANQISPNNLVVTEKGALTDNAVAPMSENAPKQTNYIVKEDLPAQVLQLNVGNGQFSPKEFSTSKEKPTSFSLTSIDDYSHFISFDDPSLSAVMIFVGPKQTKAITFQAPKTAGIYTFRCGTPGHADKGEIGKMIIK